MHKIVRNNVAFNLEVKLGISSSSAVSYQLDVFDGEGVEDSRSILLAIAIFNLCSALIVAICMLVFGASKNLNTKTNENIENSNLHKTPPILNSMATVIWR